MTKSEGRCISFARHVNIVLCNTEDVAIMLHLAFPQIGISDFALQEYRKYKVKGKPEGKELKRRRVREWAWKSAVQLPLNKCKFVGVFFGHQ